MSYDSQPDIDHIQKLATAYKSQWASQAALDTAMLGYILATNTVDVNKTGAGTVKGFRSGIGGIIVKEDAAIITVDPGLHVNPPTEKEEDKDHASLLEDWLSGAWKFSQQGGIVWRREPLDLRGFGRAWSNLYPNPRLWATPEYNDMVKRLVATNDEQERRDIDKEIREFKRDRWPIRWRYVSPRNTWTTFSGDIWLPEVSEIRMMRRDAIIAEFGTDALPKEFQSDKTPANMEIEVFEWANHQWCATVIGGKQGTGQFAREPYEHGLGTSPYILGEAELLPDNDRGWRWAGALFYAQSMIDTFDEQFSDLRENHRDNTRTQVVFYVDQKEYESDVKASGRPPQIEFKAGGEPITLWATEKVELAPVPQINPQSLQLLEKVTELIYSTQIRPVERGEAKSGTSQNQFVTAVQIAEREFDPSMAAIKTMAEEFGRKCFRAVQSLSREYPDDPDKVAVFVEKGLIEVGPDDVKGWENAIQARAQRAIPIDKNLINAQAQQELQMGIARETVYEQTLGFENPKEEERKTRRQQMADLMFQQVVMPRALAWAQQQALAPTPEELQQIQQMLPQASPDLQAFAQQLMPGAAPPLMNGGMPPGPMPPMGPPGAMPAMVGANQGQTNANLGRTGVPQAPQTPQQMVIPNG